MAMFIDTTTKRIRMKTCLMGYTGEVLIGGPCATDTIITITTRPIDTPKRSQAFEICNNCFIFLESLLNAITWRIRMDPAIAALVTIRHPTAEGYMIRCVLFKAMSTRMRGKNIA